MAEVEDESHRLAIIGAPQRAQRIDRTGLDAYPLKFARSFICGADCSQHYQDH